MHGKGVVIMELPLNTIVITVLVLFVLAAVGIVFFSQAGATNDATNEAQCVQMCFSAAAQVAAGSQVDTAKHNFCEHSCDKVMNCSVADEQKINC